LPVACLKRRIHSQINGTDTANRPADDGAGAGARTGGGAGLEAAPEPLELLPANPSAAALLDAAARMVSHERLIHTCSAIAVPHTTAPAAPAADALPGPARRGGSGGGGADSRDVHQAGNLVDGGAGAAELAEGGVLGVVLLQLGIGPVRAQQLWERALNTWSKGPKAALVWRCAARAGLSSGRRGATRRGASGGPGLIPSVGLAPAVISEGTEAGRPVERGVGGSLMRLHA
jgi:hypothetical protein